MSKIKVPLLVLFPNLPKIAICLAPPVSKKLFAVCTIVHNNHMAICCLCRGTSDLNVRQSVSHSLIQSSQLATSVGWSVSQPTSLLVCHPISLPVGQKH